MTSPNARDIDFDAIASDILDATSEAKIPDNLSPEQYCRLADYQLMDALLAEFFRDDADKLDHCITRAIRAIETDSNREALPRPVLGSLGDAWHGVLQYLPQQVFLSYLIGGVFTGLLILAASLVTVTHPHSLARKTESSTPSIVRSDFELVGHITGMVDVRWSDPNTSTQYGVGVPRGRKYALASGLMEITYDSGATVILQGPATYEVESKNGGFLSIGKLTAKLEKKQSAIGGQQSEEVARRERSEVRGPGAGKVVSGQWSVVSESGAKSQNSEISKSPNSNSQSLIPNLFVIHTPTATVTDLGTEFGVEVTKEGATTSHVFRGSVRVQMISAAGRFEGEAQVLGANQSVRVPKTDAGLDKEKHLVIFSASEEAASFVREIRHQNTPQLTTKIFDLVDVVAGGNGFSGRRNAGIDPTNGQRSSKVDYTNPAANDTDRFPFPSGDGKYHRVAEMRFVDGVFIPDGSRGPVQVDSAGHVFEDCPKTSNRTAHYLWAGSGAVPTLGAPSQTTLGIVDYAQKEHCYLFIHSNKGVTFDLEAIRKANPDATIRRFLAVLGNASVGLADVWILVNGKERFCRREISNAFVAMPVDIPIRKEDCFLTLIATDGGNDFEADWIMLGDPRLELTTGPSDRSAVLKSRTLTGKEPQ